MMKKTVLMCLVVLVALVGCKRDPVDIYKQNESGVVMVLNKFYYKMRLPNGRYLYFSGLDEDGNLENLTDVEEKYATTPRCRLARYFLSTTVAQCSPTATWPRRPSTAIW